MDGSGGVPPRTLDILPDEPAPRRGRTKRDAPPPGNRETTAPAAPTRPVESTHAAPAAPVPQQALVTPTEPYPSSPPAPVAAPDDHTRLPAVTERPPAQAQVVPANLPERHDQYSAGLRALQEAFAIDIAEREDRHRGEMHALQQSFANDVAARDNHHRAELNGVHQRFTADIAVREERHRGEMAALQQSLEEMRTQLGEAATNRGREAEARATVEAELEWHRGELQGTRNEVIRLKSQAAGLGTSLQDAKRHGERWIQEARRLETELKTARAEAEQAATAATSEIDKTNAQLFDTVGRLEASQEQVARLSEQSAALEVAGGQLRQTIAEQRAVRERLTEERDAARQHSAAVEGQLRTAEFDAEQAAEDAARQLADATRRIETADEHVARLAGQNAVHEATIEEQRQVLAEQQGALKKITLEHDAAAHRIAELDAELAVAQHKAEADAVPADEPGTPSRKPATARVAKPSTARHDNPKAAAEPPAETEAQTEAEPTDESDDRPVSLAEGMSLVTWQRDALAAWNAAGHRGVVEAVTGKGNTRVAHWAVGEALDQDMKVLVLVPTAERAEQWYSSLRTALPINRVGKHTGGKDERHGTYDVVVATAEAAARERVFGQAFKGLIVADDVHTFGTPDLSLALDPRYSWRLGITTVYERADDGIATYLDPYFGGVSYRLGYARALADGMVAPFDIALVTVRLSASEKTEYDALGQQAKRLATELISAFAVRAEPADAFASGVAALADGRLGPARTAARAYQKTVAKQSELVAINTAKDSVLKALTARVRDGQPALMYLEGQQTASHVAKLFARESCAARALPAGPDDICLLVGPRHLGEPVSPDDVDLAVVVGAGSDKRQMIERLDRVISGSARDRRGRLVVLHAEGTDEQELTSDDAPFVAAVRPYAATLKRFNPGDTGALLEFLAPAQP